MALLRACATINIHDWIRVSDMIDNIVPHRNDLFIHFVKYQ